MLPAEGEMEVKDFKAEHSRLFHGEVSTSFVPMPLWELFTVGVYCKDSASLPVLRGLVQVI